MILKSGNEQDYGKIEKILGNGRFNLLCNDKITRLGIIRGKMRKRNWVNMGSIVLYSIREYEKDKVRNKKILILILNYSWNDCFSIFGIVLNIFITPLMI